MSLDETREFRHSLGNLLNQLVGYSALLQEAGEDDVSVAGVVTVTCASASDLIRETEGLATSLTLPIDEAGSAAVRALLEKVDDFTEGLRAVRLPPRCAQDIDKLSLVAVRLSALLTRVL